MNITASDVKDAKLTATVTIPAADVDAAIKKAYKETAKKYRFPGFRAGKAPRPVIDSALGAEATLAQATNALIAANEPAGSRGLHLHRRVLPASRRRALLL